jgi:hypothetical protein
MYAVMKQELRDIPPAPRRVRWRPLFAHRWLLFVPGVILLVIGSLIAWLMFLQSGGQMSRGPRLAAGPSTRTTGTLTKVGPPLEHWDDTVRQAVQYEFRAVQRGQTRRGLGVCFVPEGTWAIGAGVEVDYLDDDPDVSCIPGGVMQLDSDWLRARFWMTVMAVPGALLLLGWLAGAFQLRQVLMHGDVSVGVVHRVARVPFLLPEMLRVDYTFRDHHAKTRHNHHWVRAHGELGRRLLAQMWENRYEEMPVLHDRALPHWNRMLLPADFWPQPPIDIAGVDKAGTPL